MVFQEKVKKSLGVYKRDTLGIKDDGIYKYRNNNYFKEHILPEHESKQKNIISQYRNDFWKDEKSKITYHKYFHHLNSSQALCINLFFPLYKEHRLDIILELLGLTPQNIKHALFEKTSEIETVNSKDRKTNFDFYLKLENNNKIFFEIKYTESEFGKAKDDDKHQAKFISTYKPLLISNNFINEEFKEMKTFFNNYQIMRNLVHLNNNCFVVFLFPEDNKNINYQAQTAFEKILNDAGKERFKILYLEETINHIINRNISKKLQDHFDEFKRKYLSY